MAGKAGVHVLVAVRTPMGGFLGELKCCRTIIGHMSCQGTMAGKSFAKEAAMAKLFVTDAGEQATRDALQIFGGYGYIKDFPLECYCHDIWVASIYKGMSEIQKTVISRA